MKKFICASCGKESEYNKTHEQAMKEYVERFPEQAAEKEPIAIVCDDCNREISAWLDTLTPEEKFDMRQRWKGIQRLMN